MTDTRQDRLFQCTLLFIRMRHEPLWSRSQKIEGCIPNAIGVYLSVGSLWICEYDVVEADSAALRGPLCTLLTQGIDKKSFVLETEDSTGGLERGSLSPDVDLDLLCATSGEARRRRCPQQRKGSHEGSLPRRGSRVLSG